MNIPHFIYPVDGHLGCFQFSAIMSNTAMNIHIHILHEHMFSFLLGIYLRSGATGSYGNSRFNILRNYQTVS